MTDQPTPTSAPLPQRLQPEPQPELPQPEPRPAPQPTPQPDAVAAQYPSPLIPALQDEDDVRTGLHLSPMSMNFDDAFDDVDSALGDDAASIAHSVTASILEYRTIMGRTYHSERHDSKYFTPNDEQQMRSQDLTHHYLTLLLDNKLFLAPVGEDMKRVLDVGTGTGIWAIDMGDRYPGAEVTGTDLSPTQPPWVPPNVRFRIDDCTQDWSLPADAYDLVHLRYLFGAVADWRHLLRNAFRCCHPGSGWAQSVECDVIICSDDASVPEGGAIETFWNPLWREMTKNLGISFQVLEERLQIEAFEEAGFVDITEVNFKLPVGGWPRDPKLAEVGEFVLLTMINDLEGYTLLPWNIIHGENTPGYREILYRLRRELRSKSMHGYMKVRYMYGRKPEHA
ncbi:S-adenosyl-L-methionine-dependent methyltransferase [Durotheca rogersii]|uniref:S-adenosyl-L-methionine-dependent methyltransferase n=1 Tax=Durotheca rogersii TaxID=419775 RepID=UPI00221E99FC|nr:S-adenosyl-L-methionine-dependent methyltransferase [Durotheca rogersii]KAI5865635.1 S-adenosyl-L-methionine-dependent methyltransferase [Durotheca rogersii]